MPAYRMCMCKCAFRFDEEQNEPELAAPLSHVRKSSRDAGKYSRSPAGWKDCNQTINQKSLNCHPPTPFSLPLSLFCYYPPTTLCRAPCMACYAIYKHALEEVDRRPMKNAFSPISELCIIKSCSKRKIWYLFLPRLWVFSISSVRRCVCWIWAAVRIKTISIP